MRSAPADPVHRKYRMTAREWLVVLLAAVLLHVLFFCLFRPLPNRFAESDPHRRHTRFLYESDLRKVSRLGDLRYWLRYTEPERLLKPDPEIYRRAIAGSGYKAEEILFVDDSQKNIDGAVLQGMYAVLMHPGEDILRTLVRYALDSLG